MQSKKFAKVEAKLTEARSLLLYTVYFPQAQCIVWPILTYPWFCLVMNEGPPISTSIFVSNNYAVLSMIKLYKIYTITKN